MRTAAHGIAVEVPQGWEARVFRREGAGPVLHLASFPLHPRDGDFGAAATGRMRADDMFAALVQYRPDEKLRAGHGLFAGGRPPRPRAEEFSRGQLEVTRAGQLGWQRFFSEEGAPCCLYAVIQPVRVSPARLVRRLAAVVATVRLGP